MTRDGEGTVPKDASRTVLDLVAALDAAGVTYCHWKSNAALDRSLRAENDLDLLIDRRDAARAGAVLHSLGFRTVRKLRDPAVPALVDHLTLDTTSGRVVHVQAHYQLVVGDDMTKNYRLPVEDAYLASRSTAAPLPTPSAEWELLVLLLRLGIKHCPWDAVLMGKGRPTRSERAELVTLRAAADPATLDALRDRFLPMVPAGLLAQVETALEPHSSAPSRALVGARLLHALAPLAREQGRTDLRLRVWRRVIRRRRAQAHGRRVLDTGGAIIGVVGGDGSGKSSVVETLSADLGRFFPVETIHLGKPPRAWTTRVAARVRRRIGGVPTSLPAWTDWDAVGHPGLGFLATNVLQARDRRRAHRAAQRKAARGWVVISDRWPLREIDAMDAPRGVRIRPEGRLGTRFLARLEARYFEEIGRPDVLVVLRVDPEIAVKRRPEQDADFVRRRATEVWEHDWSGTGTVVVDAGRSQEAVLAEVRAAVWNTL